MAAAHLLHLLSLFSGISVLQQVRSWSIAVPKTVTAVEGSCAVVPCQTQPHSRVTWYQYDSIQYFVVYDDHLPPLLSFKGRTSVLGRAAEGNCTLMINNVQITDNNLQVYVWINPDSKISQRFYDQTTTIFVERKTPIISVQKRMMEGDSFQANCSIGYSCPFSPPSLHWRQTQLPENSTLSTTFNEQGQGQSLYTETLHGVATYEMHKSSLSCSAEFKTFTAKSRAITLNILYKPRTVSLMLKKEPELEGSTVVLECVANCNPPAHTYSWLKRQMGRETRTNSTRRQMSFDNITRDTSLSCMAHNDVGAGQSDWLDLDVQYAPVILPGSNCLLTGETLKCVCQAGAFPSAFISWSTDGNETLLSSFTFVNTSKGNVVTGVMSGQARSEFNISCTVTNSVGSDTKQLSVENSKTSFLPMWLIALIVGVALLLGCAIFVYIKCPRKRHSTAAVSIVCNTTTIPRLPSSSENVQLEPIYSNPQRPGRPESNPELDRLSCIYDNDFVRQVQPTPPQRSNNNNPAARHREAAVWPTAKVQQL